MLHQKREDSKVLEEEDDDGAMTYSKYVRQFEETKRRDEAKLRAAGASSKAHSRGTFDPSSCTPTAPSSFSEQQLSAFQSRKFLKASAAAGT